MKKILFLVPVILLLAASCQKQTAQNNSTSLTSTTSQQTNQNQDSATTTTRTNVTANFQNGNQILTSIQGAFKKAGSFSFSGQVTENFAEGYQDNFTNNFTGKLIWPQMEEDSNSIHDTVSGANGTTVTTYNTNSIVVNNKKFDEIVDTGSTPKQGAQGWQADFVVSPLDQKMGVPTQAYQFPNWLVLDYAETLQFQKQDGDLYEYTIVPKTLQYEDAIHLMNHQGRLEDGNNSFESQSSAISGTVWINKDFFVTKEEVNIQRWNDADAKTYHEPKEGTAITINYSDYNQKFSVQEPIATPQLDEITQKVQAGESPQQIDQDLSGVPAKTPAQLDTDTQKQLNYFDSFTSQCNFNSTADWKTLTDSRYGYTTTFKYPSCWSLWTNPMPEMSDDYFLVRNDSAPNPEGFTFSGDQPPLLAPWVEIGPAAIFTDTAGDQEYEQENFDTITKQTQVNISGYSGTITQLTYDPTACAKFMGQTVQNIAGGATNCQTIGNNTVALNIADPNSTSVSVLGIKIQSNNTDTFDYAGLMNKIISTMTVTQNGNKNLDSHQ